MELKRYRRQFDKIDRGIIKLLAKRIRVAKRIGEYKVKRNIEIFQPSREEVIKKRLIKSAEKYHIDPHFLNSLWNHIMSEAIRVQEKIFEKYREERNEKE